MLHEEVGPNSCSEDSDEELKMLSLKNKQADNNDKSMENSGSDTDDEPPSVCSSRNSNSNQSLNRSKYIPDEELDFYLSLVDKINQKIIKKIEKKESKSLKKKKIVLNLIQKEDTIYQPPRASLRKNSFQNNSKNQNDKGDFIKFSSSSSSSSMSELDLTSSSSEDEEPPNKKNGKKLEKNDKIFEQEDVQCSNISTKTNDSLINEANSEKLKDGYNFEESENESESEISTKKHRKTKIPHFIDPSTYKGAGARIPECSVCKMLFKTVASYFSHISLAHAQEFPFSCSKCSKMFRTKAHLSGHARIHGDKNFACSYCSKEFYYKAGLVRHIKSHKRLKEHSCLVCGKEFAQKSHLDIHAVVHEENRAYECLSCGIKFKNQNAVVRHCRKNKHVYC